MVTNYTYDEMCDYLFEHYAPAFNFEKDGEQLLHIALERGFVTYEKVDNRNRFSINKEWCHG